MAGTCNMRNGLLTLALLGSLSASAYTLRISGLVSDYHGGGSMSGVLVRVYKNGVKVDAFESNAFGRYNVKLENNADYVLRFSGEGFVTKCFGVDTHGLVWEGEDNVKELFVEMTMVERIAGCDFELFDMPVGRLKFEPATGLVSWNREYEQWIRPQVEEVMRRYDALYNATAETVKPSDVEGSYRR